MDTASTKARRVAPGTMPWSGTGDGAERVLSRLHANLFHRMDVIYP
jgi:hypothetical protein